MLLIPAAGAAAVRADAALRPHRDDVELVETAGAGPVVLVRPDGHVAAKGRPGRMPAVTGYLRGLFGEPGSVPAVRPGADVQAFALGAEEAEDLGGFRAGVAERVRNVGVELRHLSGRQDDPLLGERQVQPPGQDVEPL